MAPSSTGASATPRAASARRVLLIHGAATTARVWDRLVPLLVDAAASIEVVAAQRRSSGDLATELADLAPMAEGAVVVGVSGGATLGLALLAGQARVTGAVLHEPAVGSLVPGLLDHVIAGYREGGVAGFARALYGPSWTEEMAPDDARAVARDLAMFRAYQPAPVRPGHGPVLVTVGADSPPLRHRAARALGDAFGLPTRVLPGCRHFVQQDNPEELAAVVLDVVRRAA